MVLPWLRGTLSSCKPPPGIPVGGAKVRAPPGCRLLHQPPGGPQPPYTTARGPRGAGAGVPSSQRHNRARCPLALSMAR